MRQMVLALAFLAAMLSGWTPVLAASVHAAATVSQHAIHASGHAAGQQPADHEDQKHKVVHPLMCSACFALPAEDHHIAPASTASDPAPSFAARLSGGIVAPLEPPPRR